MVGERSLAEARQILHENHIPMSIFPEVPGQVLGAMKGYSEWLAKGEGIPFMFDNRNIDQAGALLGAAKPGQALGEAETRPILAAYGLDLVAGGLAKDALEAAQIAEDLGFPVVVKVISPQVLHKSDFGGIALNLNSGYEVESAALKMAAEITEKMPEVKITGFLVEKMAPKGLEVIIGMRRDPTFGPLMMFGLGGIYVELFKDVGFGVAPMTQQRARDMIEATKAGRLLRGFRGGPVYDLEGVVDAIGRLSQLAVDFPQISEVEINPLLVLPEGQGAKVLDARLILE